MLYYNIYIILHIKIHIYYTTLSLSLTPLSPSSTHPVLPFSLRTERSNTRYAWIWGGGDHLCNWRILSFPTVECLHGNWNGRIGFFLFPLEKGNYGSHSTVVRRKGLRITVQFHKILVNYSLLNPIYKFYIFIIFYN